MRFRTTSGLDSAVDPVQMKNVTFEHVKGVEEAKNELQDVVEFLKKPQKFTVLGGKLPKGTSSVFILIISTGVNENSLTVDSLCRDSPCRAARHREDPASASRSRGSRRSFLLRLRVGV